MEIFFKEDVASILAGAETALEVIMAHLEVGPDDPFVRGYQACLRTLRQGFGLLPEPAPSDWRIVDEIPPCLEG